MVTTRSNSWDLQIVAKSVSSKEERKDPNPLSKLPRYPLNIGPRKDFWGGPARESCGHFWGCLHIEKGLAFPDLHDLVLPCLPSPSASVSESLITTTRPLKLGVWPSRINPILHSCIFVSVPSRHPHLALTAMLSLASLLNPAPPGPLPPTPRYRPSPALSSPAPSFTSECHNLFFDRHISSSKHSKMVKDSGGFVKSKAKGTVNFPPFESLDEHSVREIRRYQIYPWGKIQEYCRHIPYNSGKKDFYDKTGRESFEGKYLWQADYRHYRFPPFFRLKAYDLYAVFQYTFKVPGDETEYTVMWDYNVGLVRMTPFFKCCKYSKVCPISQHSDFSSACSSVD